MLNKSYIWRYMYGVTQMNKWCFKDLDCIFQDDLIQVCFSSLGMSLLELRKRSLGRAACTSCVPQFCVNQVISLAYLSLLPQWLVTRGIHCLYRGARWQISVAPHARTEELMLLDYRVCLVCLLNIFTRVSRAIKNNKTKIKRKKESSTAKYI